MPAPTRKAWNHDKSRNFCSYLTYIPDMDIFADLRYASRRLRQRPGLLITSLLTLAIGIGFNALVFGFVDSFLLKPLPFADPNRVVNLTFGEKQNPSVSYPDYLDIRDRNQVFSEVAGERIEPMALSGATRNARLWGYEVTGNYFHLLGIQPLRGRFPRTLRRREGRCKSGGRNQLCVLAAEVWRRPGFGWAHHSHRWPSVHSGRHHPARIPRDRAMVPLRHLDPNVHGAFGRAYGLARQPFDHQHLAIARLRPGVGRARVEASLRVLASQMAREHADVNEGFRMGTAPVGLVGATLRGPFMGIATALLLVSTLTLLVACANLSGLVLAHAAARQKEIAIRYAMGAGRGAILRMMAAESLLIALGGAVLGFLTGVLLARGIEASKPLMEFPIDTHFGMDWRVAGFAVALSLVSAALFGLLPVLRASRVDLAPALKSGAASGLSSRHWTLRDVFVGVQVAFCMVLVAGALMMVKTLRNTVAEHFGFDPADAVTLRFDLAMQGYSKERGVEFQRLLLDRVRALPGVQAAGLADRPPLSIDSASLNVSIEGAPSVPLARLPIVESYNCGPDFFRSLGTPFVAGRDFNSQDKEGAPRVAIVNQTFADKLLAGRDPLGSRFRFGTDGEWMQIVGVVQPGKIRSITENPQPALWTALAQGYHGGLTLVVRSGQADAALLGAIRNVMEQLDPDVSVYEAKTLRQHLDVPLTPLRWTTALLTAMGAVVLFLASLGLYGILSYTIGRQTREIGIRLALGAQSHQVLVPVLTRTMVVVITAAAIGMGLSIPTTRFLANLLSGKADVSQSSWHSRLLLVRACWHR